VAEALEGRVEREQVVAAFLEDADRAAFLGEHIGRGGAARPRTDDDDVEVRHR
jgi:hypothetical protein